MKERTPPTKTKLQALRAFDYEDKMLWEMANRLYRLAIGEEKYQEPIVNALVESFAAHSRVLIEFLYPSSGVHKDTILAQHFFTPNKKWKEIRPKQPQLLNDTRNMANNYLAHLTYTRSEGKLPKNWHFVKIAKEIGRILKLFNESEEIQTLREMKRSGEIAGP